MYRVRCVYYEQRKIPEKVFVISSDCGDDIVTCKKKVCVVGKLHPLPFNSCVVMLVHVMHNETTWPPIRLKVNLRVQILMKRAHKLRLSPLKDV